MLGWRAKCLGGSQLNDLPTAATGHQRTRSLALAARTPVGLLAETTAAAVRAGISRLEEYPYALASGEPGIAAHDLRLEHEVLSPRRVEALLASVLDEIDRKLGDTLRMAGHVRVLLALPQSRPGFSDDDATHLARAVLGHRAWRC